MKRSSAILFVLALVLSLSACGGGSAADGTQAAAAETPSTADTADTARASADPAAGEDASAETLRPEFKQAMDSYEAFYTEYCEFLKKYQENPTDMALLAEYTDMVAQADEMAKSFAAWEDDDLNSEELKYYLDVNNRTLKMLVDVTG